MELKELWAYFKSKGMNEFGIAGLFANINAESAFKANNLQGTGNKRLGMTDEEYTAAVDSGEYSREQFRKDSIGYGLCQWTYHSRKAALYDYAKKCGKSIGDEIMQVDFLISELKTSYKAVWKVLCNATSVREASDAVMLKFERPKNQSESARKKRAGYGEAYYKKYASVAEIKVEPAKDFSFGYAKTYTTTSNLNLRAGAGKGKQQITVIPKGAKVRCYGYYTVNGSTHWLLVQYGKLTGFCSKKYLK